MTVPGTEPRGGKIPGAIVRDFVRDPMIRIIGFLLLVAGAVLLYISPESAVPLRWRGGPVPSHWQRVTIDPITIALPPDMNPVDASRFENGTLTLEIFTGDAAYPIVRDPAAMTGFRALSTRIQKHEVRIATWTLETTGKHQFGAAFTDRPLTLLFTTANEDTLEHAKTAIHSIQFNDPPSSAQ